MDFRLRDILTNNEHSYVAITLSRDDDDDDDNGTVSSDIYTVALCLYKLEHISAHDSLYLPFSPELFERDKTKQHFTVQIQELVNIM